MFVRCTFSLVSVSAAPAEEVPAAPVADCAGASEARVLDNFDPLAKLAAKR